MKRTKNKINNIQREEMTSGNRNKRLQNRKNQQRNNTSNLRIWQVQKSSKLLKWWRIQENRIFECLSYFPSFIEI